MTEFNASILQLQDLEFSLFNIPDYQRPYIWSIKETRQLWEDILLSIEQKKNDYRIGTIILHNNKETHRLDIVDGQQRLTTLSLLLYLLSDKSVELPCQCFLEQKQFLHKNSIENIQNNAIEIQQWINDELEDSEIVLKYVLTQCSMVEIRVNSITEAFQMFDSQNGRGLTLEAYNLLKAYHLRYFGDLPEEEKILHDRTWESSARNNDEKDYLKQLIDEQLYRTRIWSRHYPAYSFTKKTIGEFKGCGTCNLKYPYQNFVNSQQLKTDSKNVVRFADDGLSPITQINQSIVNGTSFFEYIQNYVKMYKLLFLQSHLHQHLMFFADFYKDYCIGFKKKGDYYLLELYKSLVMLVFDKFGIVGLKKYHQLLYAYVFRFRLEKKFVKFDSVAQFPAGTITQIHHAKDLLDLNFIKKPALADIHKQVNNHNNGIVERFFNQYFNVNIR